MAVDSTHYWQDFASCNPDAPNAAVPSHGAVDALFFTTGKSTAEAQAVCLACPVANWCRAYVDAIESVVSQGFDGVYAGETPWQRRTRRNRAMAAP